MIALLTDRRTGTWMGAALALALIVAGGCSRGPRPGEIAGAPAAEQILAGASARAQDTRLSAKGRASVRMQVGERELPALSLSLGLRDGGQLAAVMRPGVLAPVLSLWAGEDGWLLRLPRERAAFEVVHAPGTLRLGADNSSARGAGEAADEALGALSGPALSRLAAWVLEPQSLLGRLRDPEVAAGEGHWELRGTLPGLGVADLWAEVWLARDDLAVQRWSLGAGSAEEPAWVRVAYSPARAGGSLGRQGQRIHFEIGSIEVTGTATFNYLRADVPDPLRRPTVPDHWIRYAGAELPAALGRLRDGLCD